MDLVPVDCMCCVSVKIVLNTMDLTLLDLSCVLIIQECCSASFDWDRTVISPSSCQKLDTITSSLSHVLAPVIVLILMIAFHTEYSFSDFGTPMSYTGSFESI